MAIEEKEEQTTSLKDLIELIEKDPLPSNVFTIEDKDPMVILGKLNEVIAYLKTLKATISSSDEKANQALDYAISALSSANDSLTASTTALNSSNLALETANLAIDTANTSLEGSNQAKTASSEAIDTANNALQIAQEALAQVVTSLGSKIYDNNGNLLANVKFSGHNGVNVDLAEDNETIDIRLDEDITKAIEDNHTAIEQTKAQVQTIEQKAQANGEDIVNITDMLAGVEEKVETELPNRIGAVEGNISQINSKVARALLTPVNKPSQRMIVCVDSDNNQELLKIGTGLAVGNGDSLALNYQYQTLPKVNSTLTGVSFGGNVDVKAKGTTTIDLADYISGNFSANEIYEVEVCISIYGTNNSFTHLYTDLIPASSTSYNRGLAVSTNSRSASSYCTLYVNRYIYVNNDIALSSGNIHLRAYRLIKQ